MSKVIITYKQCKAARELLGWKQDDLAQKAGISAGTIADFERGMRELRVSTLEKIVDAFKVERVTFENSDSKLSVELNK